MKGCHKPSVGKKCTKVKHFFSSVDGFEISFRSCVGQGLVNDLDRGAKEREASKTSPRFLPGAPGWMRVSSTG